MSDSAFETKLECRYCGETTFIENLDTETEWQYVDRYGIDSGGGAYFSHHATYPECIATAADGAVRTARETGLVKCLHPDHNSHVPGSDTI